MKIFKSDFDTWYDELTESWTLVEEVNTANAIVDMNTLNVDNLTDEDWLKIKEASIELCKHFGVDETSWPYQFQLQYNAYQAETLALSLLNNRPDIVDNINKMLEKNKAPYRVGGTYHFNPLPCAHNILGAVSQLVGRNSYNVDSENSNVVDLHADNKDLVISKSTEDLKDKQPGEVETLPVVTDIEVKCVAGSNAEKNAKHFHGCQVLFIFNISADTCTVYSVKRQKQKESFKIENVGIKSKCISVKPQLDPSVAVEVEVTCSRWGSKQ